MRHTQSSYTRPLATSKKKITSLSDSPTISNKSDHFQRQLTKTKWPYRNHFHLPYTIPWVYTAVSFSTCSSWQKPTVPSTHKSPVIHRVSPNATSFYNVLSFTHRTPCLGFGSFLDSFTQPKGICWVPFTYQKSLTMLRAEEAILSKINKTSSKL